MLNPVTFLGVTDSTAEAAADCRAGSKKVKAARVDVVIGTGLKKSKTMRTREDEPIEGRTVPSVTFIEEPEVRSKRVKAARVEVDITDGSGVPTTFAGAVDCPNGTGSASPVTT